MPEPLPRWKAYGVGALNVFLPGLGHFALGRRARGAAFFLIVCSMFALGLALDGVLFPWRSPSWLFRLAGLGEMGMGLGYAAGRLLGWGLLAPSKPAALMFGYGNTCLVTAGLMNMLLMMDCFDIAICRKK